MTLVELEALQCVLRGFLYFGLRHLWVLPAIQLYSGYPTEKKDEICR
ncbi:hypothetical protein XNC1_0492 [Xenorhabdus nematophila ATCC 19061]|uniref:Uncharacterized protein n=1 Tax=Xenorhabdus nematophila (strain ATCC 19061 / DSM 3370 / CCUG 14189 / LMG 1036 / NCIMB 9965 / AN6) TaxID=406817 RepID=D3VIL6_XENNA|nr:hypothetical protein XNC1_0492 [Xenorhabdus nematophila ATCC 19061]